MNIGTKSGPLFLHSPRALHYLMFFTALMLFTLLGGREIWTLETRWANIVLNMLRSGDYFHPILKADAYYDKPLLSYWLIVASSWLTDGLTLFSLRFSSAMSGLLTVYCTYRLALRLYNKRIALISGWLLISCYYFVFWSRVASADLLNLAGNVFALWWYFEHEKAPKFSHYAVFSLSLAITCLSKGLLGIVVPALCLLPHLLQEKNWRRHCCLPLVISLLPALFVYFLPFLISDHSASNQYSDNGLYLVFKENIVRFFQPWDHQGPIYLYFLYLPIYTLPWAFFLPAAIYRAVQHPEDKAGRWLLSALIILFVFFTLAGSRRSYYSLPMVPLALLLIASWFNVQQKRFTVNMFLQRSLAILYPLLFIFFAIALPAYYSQGGPAAFNEQLQQELLRRGDKAWHLVLLDVDNKIPMYLPRELKQTYKQGPEKQENLSAETLTALCPELQQPRNNVVFISKYQYQELLQQMLPDHQQVLMSPVLGKRLKNRGHHKNDAIAFLPPA